MISSPATMSFATDNPPSVCSEPSVVDVASVASSVFKIPLNVPVVALNVLAPTIVPLTSKLAFTSTSVAFNSI